MAITLIAHTEVGSGGAANIEFSSIPGTYDDLLIITSLRTDRASQTNDNINIRFNGDTATNYSRTQMVATGTSVSSARGSSATSITTTQAPGNSANANTWGTATILIPAYKNTSKNKQVLHRGAQLDNSNSTFFLGLYSGLWRSTSAITSITLLPNTGPNIVQYSTATLYGVTKA